MHWHPLVPCLGFRGCFRGPPWAVSVGLRAQFRGAFAGFRGFPWLDFFLGIGSKKQTHMFLRRLKNGSPQKSRLLVCIFSIAYCNNIWPLGYNILPIACLFLLPIAYLCLLPVFGLCCTTPTSASAVASVFFWLPAPLTCHPCTSMQVRCPCSCIPSFRCTYSQ